MYLTDIRYGLFSGKDMYLLFSLLAHRDAFDLPTSIGCPGLVRTDQRPQPGPLSRLKVIKHETNGESNSEDGQPELDTVWPLFPHRLHSIKALRV